MLTIRFYQLLDHTWSVIAGETSGDCVLFIWSADAPTFGEAALEAAGFVKRYERELEPGRPPS